MMQRIQTALFAALLPILATTFACTGGGSGGGPGAGSSGVDGTKRLGELSTAETIDLCLYERELQSGFDREEVICYISAIRESDTASACEDFYERCLRDELVSEQESCELEAAGEVESCLVNVTTAQLETCLEAFSIIQTEWANSLSCSSTDDDVDWIEEQRPPACDPIDFACG